MSLRDAVFKSTTEKTFQYEESLPPLPVPPLQHTLDSYLDSVKAVVSDDEYRATEAIVRSFESGVGQKLQKLLVQRADKYQNWLEQWWEDLAYLQQRTPLIPYSNMCAAQPNADYWPIKRGTRSERTALTLHYIMQFWILMRKEQFKPVINKGSPWSMFQFKRILNGCRIPGEVKDILISNFKTETEGSTPSNVIILYRGYIFSFDLLVDDQILTPPEIESQLSYIENWCQNKATAGPAVGTLTTAERSEWAQNRQYLRSLSPKNESILDIIESAVLVFALDDDEPVSQTEIIHDALLNKCEDRWADKSVTEIAYNNGNFATSADHTPFDGFAIGTLFQYVLLSLNECNGVYTGDNVKRDLTLPSLLDFDIDDKIISEIMSAKMAHREACDDIEIVYEVFSDYGRSMTSEHKLHPEAYIQVALQVAYYRTHGKPAPTYCTATTRKFYHGRTETCRSCFPESVELAKAFVEAKTDDTELYDMLQKATKKFQRVMSNACNGHGVDRHFLGLYLVSVENDIPIPDIFMDPSFMRTGGNGTYILSTSCAGYWDSCGLVPPMVKDGYSFFYGIGSNRYTFTLSSFKSSTETSAQLLYKNLRLTLLDLRRVMNSKVALNYKL